MTAFVFDGQLVAHRDFFAGLDRVADWFAVLQPDTAALIQGEFGIDQVAVVFQQPLDSQRILVEDFFIGLQRHDDVAVGLVALLSVADEIGDEGRRHVFVIAAATGIKIAVLLDQLERIGRPVLAAGGNHVDMSDQQDRFARAGAPEARDEIALTRRRREGVNVGFGEAASTQPRRHGFGRLGGVARCCHRVDLDEFLVDVEGALLVDVQAFSRERRPCGRRH